MNRDHLVPKVIVNDAGVTTTVYVNPAQAASIAPDAGPLRGAPPAAAGPGSGAIAGEYGAARQWASMVAEDAALAAPLSIRRGALFAGGPGEDAGADEVDTLEVELGGTDVRLTIIAGERGPRSMRRLAVVPVYTPEATYDDAADLVAAGEIEPAAEIGWSPLHAEGPHDIGVYIGDRFAPLPRVDRYLDHLTPMESAEDVRDRIDCGDTPRFHTREGSSLAGIVLGRIADHPELRSFLRDHL